MNAYFDKNSKIISNNRIIEAYFAESAKSPSRLEKAWDFIVTLFLSLLQALTSAKARRIARVAGVALSLVALAGVVGAIESGALALWAGLLIGLALVGVEYLCLRPRRS